MSLFGVQCPGLNLILLKKFGGIFTSCRRHSTVSGGVCDFQMFLVVTSDHEFVLEFFRKQ